MLKVQKGFSGSEHRYLPRWAVENPIHYQLPDKTVIKKGTTKDISASGACVRIDHNLNPKDELKLTIYLSKDKYVTVQGRVVWCRLSDGKHDLGVDFFNVPDKTQELILDHAFELDNKKISRNWFKGWSDSA